MPNPIDNMFAAAFAASPFVTETLTIHAQQVEGGVARRSGVCTVRGSATPGDTYAASIADGGEGAEWTCEFPATAWASDVPLSKGAWIEADGERPELHVLSVLKLRGIYHLVCSAREGRPTNAR